MIWLISTLSEDLLTHIVGVESSRDLWLLLEKRFAGVSRTNIHQLRSRLQSITKGDSSMTTYLHSIKEIADGLAAAGQSLSESDIVAYVLGGLPEEYDPLVTSIETHLEPVTSDELHGLLLSREAVILKRQARKSSQAPFHAYVATAGNDRSFKPWQSRGRGRGRHQFSSGSPSTNTFVARPYNSGQGILPTPNHSSSGSFFPNSSVDRPLVCQICDKKGHFALTCRQRLNLFYNATQIPAQFAGPTAHFAQPSTPPSSTASPSGTVWLADSGASSHVTSNLGHLSNHSPYQGSESLRIGDGQHFTADAMLGPC
ncbi:unnamed protein product [Prunus brigantina]